MARRSPSALWRRGLGQSTQELKSAESLEARRHIAGLIQRAFHHIVREMTAGLSAMHVSCSRAVMSSRRKMCKTSQ